MPRSNVFLPLFAHISLRIIPSIPCSSSYVVCLIFSSSFCSFSIRHHRQPHIHRQRLLQPLQPQPTLSMRLPSKPPLYVTTSIDSVSHFNCNRHRHHHHCHP